jgi:glycosyltransferase involved in cell wall biosynthesis
MPQLKSAEFAVAGKFAEQKVTAVIPAFNEEKTIGKVIAEAKPFCDDIIVALAKKSSDRTAKIAAAMGARVIKDNGGGKGDGMLCAIREIADGIIVFIDADGSHIPSDIPKLVKPIKAGNADLVIGSRFLGGSEELHGDFSKFLRMFFSMCITQIINWRFKKAVGDSQNGFRAITAKAAKNLQLRSKHTEIETEMVMRCFKKGYRVFEVPSLELKRTFGKSNISLARHSWRYAWAVFRNLL